MIRSRVVAVHPNSELYGSDRMFLASVAALGAGTVAVTPADGPLGEALRAEGADHRVLPFPVLRKVDLRGRRVVPFAAGFAAAVPRLARWLRAEGAGVVYVSTVTCPVWVLAARLAGCRVVCHVHENEPDMGAAARGVLLAPLALAHRVLANSRATAAWVAAGSPRAAGRTVVLLNGVPDPGHPAPTPRPGTGRRRVVLVGRLSERKGQDVAVEALALVRASGVDASLSLVGAHFPGYEDYVTALHERVAALGLTDHVHFEGFQPDPAPYLAAADVAVVPSRVEPFGNVAVEALLAGVPTVVSDVQGLAEIVRDGDTGRVVPPGDPAALADAVVGLLADPVAAADLAARGQREARRRFSTAAYAEGVRTAVLGTRATAAGETAGRRG